MKRNRKSTLKIDTYTTATVMPISSLSHRGWTKIFLAKEQKVEFGQNVVQTVGASSLITAYFCSKMIELLITIASLYIFCIVYPSYIMLYGYYIVIRLMRSKWRTNFIKSLLNVKQHLPAKGFSSLPEEIDLLDNLGDAFIDNICFYGFSEDGSMVTFSQLKVDYYCRCRVTYRTSDGVLYVWEDELIRHRTTSRLFTGRMCLKVLEPFRKWKIIFQGFMRSSQEGRKSIYANIYMLWQCTSDPYEHVFNRTSWSFAKISAKRMIAYKKLRNMIGGESLRIDQWGGLWGTLDLNQPGQKFVRFTSPRCRSFSKHNEGDMNQSTVHFIKMKQTCWTLMLMEDYIEDFKSLHGYISYPKGEIWPLRERLVYTIERKPQMEEIVITDDGDCKILEIRSESDDEVNEHSVKGQSFKRYIVNDEASFGCLIKGETNMISFDACHVISLSRECGLDTKPNEAPLMISFLDCLSRRSDLVGGKGASLSRLLFIENELGVKIPAGFCVSTEAYLKHVRENQNLLSCMEKIQHCVQDSKIGQLEKICEEAVSTLVQTRISDITQQALKEKLLALFSTEYENEYLAVRSSSTGEDGIEVSNAGLMETILNVTGYHSIIQALLKCWSSSLSFNVVKFRRENGQNVIEPMAVVIQKMVQSQISGVLFTADPLTSNGSSIVINAFPGLGETVVSGKTNVDAILINRTLDGHVNISKRISAKNKHGDEKSIHEQDVCLQDDMALKISKVGILIEAHFGCHVDVEWAIAEGCLYVLQARPIVCVLGETEEELMHEFDTPVVDMKECLTTGNIGEMLPGAASPLTIDLFGRTLDLAAKKMYGCGIAFRYPTYAVKPMCTFYYRMFVSMSVICSAALSSLISDKNKVELLVLGEVLPENSTQNLLTFRGRKPSLFSVLIGFLKLRLESKKAENVLRSYEIMLQNDQLLPCSTNVCELLEEIEHCHKHFFEVWERSLYKSAQSVTGSAILMSILSGKSNKITPDVSADLTHLLSNCQNVYSADVPAALKDLAKTIQESHEKSYFLDLSETDGHTYLVSSKLFGDKYRTFLEKHGHRCVSEADFLEKSWAMDPTKLIRSLKTLIKLGHVDVDLKKEDIGEMVKNLKSPLTRFQKFMFKTLLVSLARRGVAKREWGKSLSIKMGDVLKRAYWRLADLLVQECRLPEQELLFFLTHTEIKTLIRTRSSELVRKTRKRRNVFRILSNYSFKKVSFNIPVPLPIASDQNRTLTFEAKGMAVSRGVVTGRACVIKEIGEMGLIKKGDILVCLFTDVGWTPYFPVLSGLVTEIGGLLSHGAVVAREYGLPCVVCMTDATKLFQTGDFVRLNATDGTLCKI
ncbi:hypothetical protein CHS0354_034105 [Potamilus streckersoni]|uniref:Phosphoenolpyruvate synthase n=1 Tax=Potamilus streckersoni TaxID=2493646 RepID=A0AAE0WC57_9BIVA|nr:hypothetical protein CHS0354_034105 [Potamilus streckersoni]